jgi:acyl-CoA thioesterase II
MDDVRATTPQGLVDQLVSLLDVTATGTDAYFGPRQAGGVGRIFGGQIIAQALMAATRTVDPERAVHSLHAYFIRSGDERYPCELKVVRDFDGRSFSTRRVAAIQNGEIILNFAASFQRPEQGFEHQDEMPDVPGPEGLRSEQDILHDHVEQMPVDSREHFLRPRVVEFRALEQLDAFNAKVMRTRQLLWFKLVAPAPDDAALQRAIWAYLSDMHLLGTCIRPHNAPWFKGEINSASLDHSVWFHKDFSCNDWLLLDAVSPAAAGGRGLNIANIFTRDGTLVASCTQEGLFRKKRT